MTKLYGIEETAQLLHLTVDGLRTLRHKHRGPVGVKVGRRVLWSQESVDRYLAQLQADADRHRQSKVGDTTAHLGSPTSAPTEAALG